MARTGNAGFARKPLTLTLSFSVGMMKTMYIKGSKWNMSHKRTRPNPFRVALLVLFIGAVIYADKYWVPKVPTDLFSATSTPTLPPETYITNAQSLEREGRLTMAIAAYKQAVEVDAKNPANYLSLAKLYIYTGDYNEAIKQSEYALLLNPESDQAMALRGWAQGLAGDYINGEGSLKEAITANPDNAAAYAYLSEVYVLMVQAGQGVLETSQNAIDLSKKAMELAPGTLETHRARGLVLEYTGNYDDAIIEFEAAIALNDSVAALHLALGRNYAAIQDYSKAITEYTKANALNPKDSQPETLISNTYLMNGDYTKAIQYAEAALADNPSNPYLYGYLGKAYYRNGDYYYAVDALRMAVQGGTTSTGNTVKGLPIDGGTAGGFYQTYGLALAKTGQCNLALQIASSIATNLREDEIAVYNAQEVILICEQLAQQGATEAPTATSGAFVIEATATPSAAVTTSPTTTLTPTP
jgi:tetratricopeptide (TPR) repeat protein